MNNLPSSRTMVARHVTIGGRLVPVTVCAPGIAGGVLPLHLDPIEVAVAGLDLTAPNDGSHEYPGALDPIEFGDHREEEDVFYSRPLRLS